MDLTAAMQAIRDIHVPGMTEFYGKLENDPFEAAQREFETVLNSNNSDNPDRPLEAADVYVARVRDLAQRYKVIKPTLTQPPFNTCEIGLYSGDVNKFEARASVNEGVCAVCQTRDNIRIAKLEESNSPGLYCKACLPKGSPR